MKKSTSFRLSEDTAERLKALSARYGMPMTYTIEMLINDRFSVSDASKNADRMIRATADFWKDVAPEDRDMVGKAFHAGYRSGWIHFQTRHDAEQIIIDI